MAGLLNSKTLPFDQDVPPWKRNCFAGTTYAAKIPKDIIDRLSGKIGARKLSEIPLEAGDAKEYIKGGQRLSNTVDSDRKHSFDSNTKAKKVARKETKIKGVKRKPTFLRSKSNDASELPPPEPTPPPIMPPPAPHRPVPVASGMLWKPVGPKS